MALLILKIVIINVIRKSNFERSKCKNCEILSLLNQIKHFNSKPRAKIVFTKA